MSGEGEEKKIIVDEDWKSQVQAEKEALKRKAATAETERPAGAAGETGPLPPASFASLVSMLATQAVMSLGQMPHPVTGKTEVRQDEAKHFIDLLEVVEQKTSGNLTPDEAAMLTALLNDLRRAFIAVSTGVTPASPAPPTPPGV